MHCNNKLQHVDVGKSKRSNNTQQNMEKILYAHLCLVYLPRIRVQWIFEKYPCCKIQNDLQIHAYMIFQLKPFSYLVKTISMLRMSIMEADNPLYQKINIIHMYICNQNCLKFYQIAIELNTNMWHKRISAKFYYLLQTF